MFNGKLLANLIASEYFFSETASSSDHQNVWALEKGH